MIVKQICTKFGLLYHNTRIWNSKCLIFYEYFAFLLITTCKFAAIYHYLSISSTFSPANRIIMLAILQTQHALCGFTIVKKCFFEIECSHVPSKFAFFETPKRKPPPNFFGGGFLQPSAAVSNTRCTHRIERAGHIKTSHSTPKQYQTRSPASR